MTDEMKLLRAFIEAAGYEIEEIWDNSPTGIPLIGECPSEYKVTKKPKKPRQAKAEVYTDTFLECWKIYPSRPNNCKQDAFIQFQKRRWEGVESSYLLERTRAYAEFCKATNKTGTELVLQAATFYGNKKRYEADFTPPKIEPKLILPRVNEELPKWAKDNGYPGPGAGEFYPQYRKRLEAELEKRTRK